ncbi:MAG: GAF domain-containing protein [Labilithrix sp.]|nr:GAF domain-containing protein [Labilithrix sp.]
MRWLVEVSSIGKTDQQKFCVEAESWQRALQAARSERGEEGPMSGFSIELLEEGYRAVDPLARVRFVVKRAPDDMPVTATVSKEPKGGVAPAAAASGSNDATIPALPPTPSSSNAVGKDKDETAKKAPRPGNEKKKKGATMTFGSNAEAAVASDTQVAERANLPAIGSSIPGLPATTLLSSREQDPTEASPLTYREYAFVVPDGTTEEVAADVLRAQLRYVEAHIASAAKEKKVGKLVNLAAFDVEFKGKPPRPPLATLTWKDWKGDPVVAFPRRGGGPSKPPRPPSKAPPSLQAAAMSAPVQASAPPGPVVVPAQAAVPAFPPPQSAPPAAAAPAQAAPSQPPPAQIAPSQPPPAQPAQIAPSQPPPAQIAPSQPPPAPPAQVAPSQPPPVQIAPSQPPPAQPPMVTGPPVPFAAVGVPDPVVVEAPRKTPSQPPPAGGPAMVRTPSGRFVRGRITGDELITSLFESMHDLHFLRDALDGGQFCLALATEVLPARAAIIHFFDLEKREWVVACTRGKDTQRLLTSRAPESDEVLRDAARRRRALVVADAASAASERYRQIGGGRSLIVAPIMQAGRALGAIEIINPLDGMPFSEDEGNAMTYIAEQYAEYLGSRGIVLDRERIAAAAAR